MKYILGILKEKFFKRQTSFPKCIEYTLFLDSQPPSLEGNAYHQTIPILALRKRYAHKTSGCGISTEEHMPKNKSFSPRTKVRSQNNYFSIQKIAIKNFAKNLWPSQSILYCRYHCFHDSRHPFILLINSDSNWQMTISKSL